MKEILKRIVSLLGYEIHRKNRNVIVPRSSMEKGIEWLNTRHFDIQTVLDVGASDGRWSTICMKYFNNAHYVLFEPQSCHSRALDSMKESLNGKITIVKKAVGKNSGMTYFDITDPFGGVLADSRNPQTVEVGVTSIDDSMKETGKPGPYLLKLDTHGFEIPILEGAAKTLNECSVLIIEAYNYNIHPAAVTFWQLCEYLFTKGFRPIDMVDILYRRHDNSLWQMDIVFIKSSWPGYEHIAY